MADPVFDEIVLPEEEDLPDHSPEWNQRRRDAAKEAEAAGLPPTIDSRQRLIDAIGRVESAGFKTPHFIGLPDEPTGDRGVTRDIENLVSSLKQQEETATGPEKETITRQRAYWEKEVAEGMSAEQWKSQTGESDPLYSHEKQPQREKFDEIVLPHSSGQFEQIVLPKKPVTETEVALAETPTASKWTLSDFMSGDRFQNEAERKAAWKEFRAGGGRVPTLSEVGIIPKEAIEGVIRYTNPVGLAQMATEAIASDSAAARVGAGAIEGVSETVASFTTPENLAQLAIMPQSKIAQVMLNLGFGAEAISHIPEQIKAFGATDDWQEKAKIATGIAASLGLPALGVGLSARRAPVRPASESEALPATTERPVEQTQSSVTADVRDVPPEAGIKEADVNAGKAPKAATKPFKPITAYHGTRSDFTEFRPFSHFGTEQAAKDALLSVKTMKGGKPRIAEVELNISRPLEVKDVSGTGREEVPSWAFDAAEKGVLTEEQAFAIEKLFFEDTAKGREAFSNLLTEKGYDGLKYLNKTEDKGSVSYVALRSDQVRPKTSVAPSVSRSTDAGAEVGFPPKANEVPTSTKNATTTLEREPIGVTATIAELERRNAPSTEPIIPNEPAGTKFPEPVEEIMSPGPGAASAKETLASYELRRFGKRFQETEGVSPEIREETGNRYYEPVPNKLTLEEASKIIDERGTDEAIRLVRDEKFEMEPRVRATLGQTLVQKLNQSYGEATAAGDAPRAKGFLDQAVDTAEYLGEFGTRLGQGVQSFAIWSRLTPEGMLESAKRSATRAGVKLTPEQMAEIRRLSLEAHAAAEGIPKQDATKKLADYMVQQTGIPASDLPLSIYYTHILSGVQTHVVNAVDTAMNVMHEVNNLAVSNPRAAASVYAGLMRGLGEGKYDGILSLQEGRRITSGKFIESPDLLEVSKFGEKGGVPIADTGKVARATKRIAESKIAKPLNAYKYVMRMMSASDAVWFRGAEEARAGLLAHRLAEATGVERAKLRSEADSILGYDRLPEFREAATKEGYTGAKAEARATELMIQSRPEQLRADAADYAGVSTYNHEPRGVLGYLSNEVAKVSNKYPALKLFVPFTRIVANVTNRGLDNTPLGILRSLKEKGLSKEERQRVLTRGIMGTSGLIGLGVLNATGAIQIHGAGPPDREKKRQLQSAGWKPFSIQVGDKYFTYTYSPIGLGVSVLGNYLDSQRYKTLDEKDALTRVAYSMSRIGQTVFSQSFLSGLSNLFTILSGDPGQSVSSLKNFFSSVATGATTPNLVRDVNHLFDPVARKSENIAQDLIRNIPVARLSLRPTLNAFGEPVEVSRNRFYSGQSDDPAWKLIANKNLRVPVVDQTTFEDSEDGYLYAKIAGERMRKYIVSNLTELKQMNEQQAQDRLSKAARSMFDEAQQDVVRHGGVKKKRKR